MDLKMEHNLSDGVIKHSLSFEYSNMSNLRIIKNLIVISLGFMFLFSAFMALTNLQSTMNYEESVGVASQSAIYSALIISTLFLPKILIKRFGRKLTLGFSMLMYSPYIAANFYPTMSTLLPTAILLGASGANVWTSAFAYINELSFMDAKGNAAKAELSTSKFFGIFSMFLQTTQIWGNLVSYYVLLPSNINSEMHQNTSFNNVNKLPNSYRMASEIHTNISITRNLVTFQQNISCGAEFCGGIEQKITPLTDSERFTLIGIFVAFAILAAAIILLFLDPLEPIAKKMDESNKLQNLAATFNHIIKTEQLLLIVLTTFTGLEQGFVFADYSEAYVACTIGLQNVGLVFVCFGIVNSVTAATAGRLLKYVPRMILMTAAAASNFGVCIVLFYWKPNVQQVWIFYVLVSFWGFSDAIWQTQLSALYGVLFRNDEEAAFASYRLCEGLGYLIAFSCSSYLCASAKIYMLIGFLVVGLTGYISLEIRTFMKNRNYPILK